MTRRHASSISASTAWTGAGSVSSGSTGLSAVARQYRAGTRAEKAPPLLPIIFGGAALEDDIAEEVMRGYPQVDYVFCGDAEMSLPEILGAILEEKPVDGLSGPDVARRRQVVFTADAPPICRTFNVTPVPEFEDISTREPRADMPAQSATARCCCRSRPRAAAGGA